MIARATPTSKPPSAPTDGVRVHRIRKPKVDPEVLGSRPTGAIQRATLYPAEVFARLLGCGRWQLHNWRAAGLPARKLPGGRIFILGDEALAWFASLPAAPSPKPKMRKPRGEGTMPG